MNKKKFKWDVITPKIEGEYLFEGLLSGSTKVMDFLTENEFDELELQIEILRDLYGRLHLEQIFQKKKTGTLLYIVDSSPYGIKTPNPITMEIRGKIYSIPIKESSMNLMFFPDEYEKFKTTGELTP